MIASGRSSPKNDAQAMQAARQYLDGKDIEVWLLDRKIGRLAAGKKS